MEKPNSYIGFSTGGWSKPRSAICKLPIRGSRRLSALYPLLACVFFWAARLNAQWLVQPVPTDQYLFDVHFADSINGWIVGLSGTILHTSDGGVNWTPQDSGIATDAFYSVYALSATTCWVVGQDTAILSTVDGGESWTRRQLSVDLQGKWVGWSVVFTDSMTGWIAGEYQQTSSDSAFILKTTDGGLSWQKVYLHYYCYGPRISAIDNQHLWLKCDDCYVLRTQDGYNWVPLASSQGCGGSFMYTDLDFVTTSFGWAAYDGLVNTSSARKSFDGGESWEGLLGGQCVLGGQSRISAIDSVNAWLVWYRFCDSLPLQVWRTRDGGAHWELQLSIVPAAAQIQNRIFMIDTLRGWIVGKAGLVLRTITGGTTGAADDEGPVPMQMHLDQNFPNPFNGSTTIRYALSEPGHAWVEVFDMLGQGRGAIPLGLRAAGWHTLALDGQSMGLPSTGVYYYRLRTQSASLVRSMLYVK